MSSLRFWSMLAIFYQTILCVIVSWLILDCQLTPDISDLYEITLLKIAYLYDPKACGKVYYYNVTAFFSNGKSFASLVWPLRNDVAANFRAKIQLWLSLHLVWAFFAIINASQGERSCDFYTTLVPFTLAGIALLVTDFVNCVLFLVDTQNTYSEAHILALLANNGQLQGINRKLRIPEQLVLQDTSWISLLLAYISIRGVVQWFVNYWLVKDNYFDGLSRYRRQLQQNAKHKKLNKSSHSIIGHV